jgi:phosphoglycolate phosphatase
MSSTPKAFLFDFSGTIVDDVKVSLSAVNYALRSIATDADEVTLGEFVARFKVPYGFVFERLGISPEGAQRIPLLFQEAYLRELDRAVLFRDAEEMLVRMRKDKVQTGIVSNTPRTIIDAVLAKQNAACLFDLVLGMEDLSAPKPSPKSIVVSAERLGRRLQEVAYVGDTGDDIQAAKAAGAVSIAVWRELGHYQRIGALISSNPKFFVNRLTEILNISW